MINYKQNTILPDSMFITHKQIIRCCVQWRCLSGETLWDGMELWQLSVCVWWDIVRWNGIVTAVWKMYTVYLLGVNIWRSRRRRNLSKKTCSVDLVENVSLVTAKHSYVYIDWLFQLTPIWILSGQCNYLCRYILSSKYICTALYWL
jgi:hypothetical protein